MAEIGRKNTLVLMTKFKEVSVLTLEVLIGLFLENLRGAGHFSPYYITRERHVPGQDCPIFVSLCPQS